MSGDLTPTPDELQAVRDLIADARVASERMDAEEATGWLIVTRDLDSGSLHIVGTVSSPEEALIIAATMDREVNDGLPAGEKGWSSTVHPLFKVEGASGDTRLGIIGRERALVDQLTRQLQSKTYHPTTTAVPTRRGARYDVQMTMTVNRDQKPTGHIMRVEVTLIRLEPSS